MKRRTVLLAKVDPNGRWISQEKFRFRDITQVEFGGGYTLALARVLQEEGHLSWVASPEDDDESANRPTA